MARERFAFGKGEYHTFTENQANILYCIWLIGYKEGEACATRNSVAEKAGVSIENLGRILNSIRNISPDKYYEAVRLSSTETDTWNRGPRPVYYRLKPQTFVTFPITARLLLELEEFPKKPGGAIDYHIFISEMATKIDFDIEDIKSRLEWTSSQDYIFLSNNRKTITSDKRIRCEISYLARIAKHLERS